MSIPQGKKSLAETHPDLAAQWSSRNESMVSEVTAGSSKKVWWIGECSHEWQSTVANRTKGSGCPYCKGRKIIVGTNDLASTHPSILMQWASRNTISPQEVSAGSDKKVWWQCDKGHEWEASVIKKVKGRGCPFCSNRKILPGINDLHTINPTLAEQWSPRNIDSPREVAPSTSKRVWWMCEKGHEWEATVHSRSTKNSGCPYCSGQRVLDCFNDLVTVAPDLSLQWSSRNTVLISNITVGSGKKVWWKCEKGHEWKASPNSRKRGSGCPYCSGQQVLIGFNDFKTIQPVVSKQWSTKNIVNPTEITDKSSKNIWWTCEKGHEWEARAYTRAYGHGCPVCNTKNPSTIEVLLTQELQNYVFISPQQTVFYNDNKKRIVVDAIINDGYILEYDGEYWHQDTLLKDTYKTKILLEQGYKVIRIRENNLIFLPLESDNLLQIRFKYSQDHQDISNLVKQITNYITSPGISSTS